MIMINIITTIITAAKFVLLVHQFPVVISSSATSIATTTGIYHYLNF